MKNPAQQLQEIYAEEENKSKSINEIKLQFNKLRDEDILRIEVLYKEIQSILKGS